MKKVVNFFAVCAIMLVVSVSLVACTTPKKAYDKMKTEITAAGYDVEEWDGAMKADFTALLSFEITLVSAFTATKETETTTIMLFHRDLLEVNHGTAPTYHEAGVVMEKLALNYETGGASGTNGRFVCRSTVPDENDSAAFKIFNKRKV